jgi:hypothetical protein
VPRRYTNFAPKALDALMCQSKDPLQQRRGNVLGVEASRTAVIGEQFDLVSEVAKEDLEDDALTVRMPTGAALPCCLA